MAIIPQSLAAATTCIDALDAQAIFRRRRHQPCWRIIFCPKYPATALDLNQTTVATARFYQRVRDLTLP